MPLCTSCTTPAPYLYTIYKSAHNLRLEQCHKCQAFVDPYVEHDVLTLLIDLLLLKPGVYRHLLYNRGTPPRHAGEEAKETRVEELKRRRARGRMVLVLKLGFVLVGIDAFIRFTHLINSPSDHPGFVHDITKIFFACLAETIAFHIGVTAVCCVLLTLRNGIVGRSESLQNGVRAQFDASVIPLTLLYSSFTKLFLLLLLTIWRLPSGNTDRSFSTIPVPYENTSTETATAPATGPVSFWITHLLDDDVLDRKWVARNLLGGMSAGFGLRVVLDAHPSITTLAILSGWAAKTFVGKYMATWVGGGEEWIGWSIP